MGISWREANMTCECGHTVVQHEWASYTRRGPCASCECMTPEGNWWEQARLNLQGTFKVEHTFTVDYIDFAQPLMVLPSYSVQFTPMNITAMTWPAHE